MSSWDYLIVTASNARQASAYEAQLRLRRELGLLPQVRESLVVADLEGRRIGSGGSTVYCLERVIEREQKRLSERRAGGTACATTTSPAFSKVAEVGQAVLACLARLRAILSPLSEHTLGARLQ